MVGFPRNATDKLSTACPRSPTIGGAHPSVGVSVAIGFGVGVVEGSSVVAIGAGVGAEVGVGVVESPTVSAHSQRAAEAERPCGQQALT